MRKKSFNNLLCFLVQSVCFAKTAIFFKFKFLRSIFLVFCGRIVPLLALCTGKCNNISHFSVLYHTEGAQHYTCPLPLNYSIIELTTPAPTVRPPSRIANRKPSSIAMGVIRFTVHATLSPGITISVPAGSSTIPVTSVVRK